MNGVAATSQLGHDAKRQFNGTAAAATVFKHFQPNVNSVVDGILGVDPGFEQEAGAQSGLVFGRPVVVKDEVRIDEDGILGGAHLPSLAKQF